MTYDGIKFWFDIAQTALIAAIGFQNYLSKKQAATTASIEQLEDDLSGKIEDQGVRLARVEQDLIHAPKHADLGMLHEKINKTSEQLSEMHGELRHIRNALDRLNQHALETR